MQTLRRLAQTTLPLAVLSYGAFYGITWSQNLFVGWAAFLAVFSTVGLLVFLALLGMSDREAKEKVIEQVPPRWDWIAKLSRASGIIELGIVVAFGWWWTAILYSWGFGMTLIVRVLIYDTLAESIEEETEAQE